MALIQNAAEKTTFLDFQTSAPSRQSSDVEFDKVMQSAKDTPVGEQAPSENAKTPAKAEVRGPMKDRIAALNSKAQQQLAAAGTEELPEEAMEAVAALLVNIRELLMDTFGVGKEELSSAMEELGFTDADLLNPETMNQLAVELAGADAMELLFQPDFMDTVKGLRQEIEGLTKEFAASTGLTPKEAEQIAEKLPVSEISADVKESKAPAQTEPVQEMTVQETVTEPVKEEKPEAKNGEKSFDQTANQHMAANQVLANVEQAVGEALPEVDAENIVRQLVERLAVTVKEDMSSFEMQLNPEHLGKINLQVVAKDGAVTAQIAAENAAVKEALESQIVTLKESLNNQGIEVEAVEVTIASHEFERNLDSQDEKGQTGEENQKKRFRFDVMEASEEELTPEDILMRDMMIANGSQINYMA